MAIAMEPVTGLNFESNLEEEAYRAIGNLSTELGRKFDHEDILTGEYRELLTDSAEKFLDTYRGRFEFVLDVKTDFRRKGILSAGQVKGICNCIAAEWRRVQERARSKRQEGNPNEVGVNLGIDGFVIPDGTYTVIRVNGEYHTLKIRTLSEAQCSNFEKPKGTRKILFLNGPDNTSDYKGFGWIFPDGTLYVWSTFKTNTRLVEDARDLLSMDKRGVLNTTEAYAKKSGRCSICGRELTVEESIVWGMGPTCRGRFGL